MTAGDEASVSVSVLVKVPPASAFRYFTEDIDQWWRSSMKYRIGGKGRSMLHLEPSPSGTLVTVKHRGFSHLRPDHPVRHGQETVAFIRSLGLWWGDLMTSLREHAENGLRPE